MIQEINLANLDVASPSIVPINMASRGLISSYVIPEIVFALRDFTNSEKNSFHSNYSGKVV